MEDGAAPTALGSAPAALGEVRVEEKPTINLKRLLFPC